MSDEANGNQEAEVCKIYDHGDFFTVLVQMMLALFALLSLWIKRMNESPRRTFQTWFLDVSKQGFGACYAHVLNMVIAAVISNNIRGDSVLEDQCAWYGISFLIDTTLGLALSIFLLYLLDIYSNRFGWTSLQNSGVYSGPNAYTHWLHQVMAWLLILTVVKLLMYFFIWGFSAPLAWIGGILFKPLQANIRFELLFVMIFFPGFMNVIYFWIADHHLKAKPEHIDAHEVVIEDAGSKTESLLDKEEKESPHDNSNLWTDEKNAKATTFV
jgi:STIMATE family